MQNLEKSIHMGASSKGTNISKTLEKLAWFNDRSYLVDAKKPWPLRRNYSSSF
jgi:hypothetical protein